MSETIESHNSLSDKSHLNASHHRRSSIAFILRGSVYTNYNNSERNRTSIYMGIY